MHQVWLNEEPRLTASRTADDQHVFIPRGARVFRAAVHRQALGLREDHVVLRHRVDVGRYVLMRTPASRAVFLIFAESLSVFALGVYRKAKRGGDEEADQQIKGMKAERERTERGCLGAEQVQHLLRSVAALG